MLELPWRAPPLSLNHRHNPWEKAALTRELRKAAWARARQAKIGRHEHVAVTLHWRPGRRGTYDEDNPMPTLKACADGIVDAGVVDDDDRTRMAKDVEIHDPVRGQPGRLWLTVAY